MNCNQRRSRRTVAGFTCLLSLLLHGCGEGSDGMGGGSSAQSRGSAGSTAKMVLVDDYLYAISGNNVQLFDVSVPAMPNPWALVRIDWDIQTLFPHGDYLLVGAADGVHILDNSDRASPVHVGDFTHAIARDPVVAQGTTAFVTLKADPTRPGPQIESQLNVLDIADVTNATLLNTVPMRGPSGLAVDGERLYVCDGTAGLTTFDVSTRSEPRVLHKVRDVNCHDLIVQDDLLIVIAEDGLLQFDLTTGVPLLLSEIASEPVIYVVDR